MREVIWPSTISCDGQAPILPPTGLGSKNEGRFIDQLSNILKFYTICASRQARFEREVPKNSAPGRLGAFGMLGLKEKRLWTPPS